PFMRAYTELLVRTCHRRGAHAIGGMAAFIPSRRDAEVNANALARVREDKGREASDGYDGAWVAHPDLVPVVQEVFDRVLEGRPHQKERRRADVRVTGKELLDVRVPGGRVTSAGVRGNVSVALQYLQAWLQGSGAVAINNMMEDTATAEIARAQLWHWIRHKSALETGEPLTAAMFRQVLAEESATLDQAELTRPSLAEAARLLDRLVTDETFAEFLTTSAYDRLA
ncbi:MAG: malate synthase A, partial [Gemmatimonadales bacterium]|nr:malate synthase A [Gemmatimonadales bacterium]